MVYVLGGHGQWGLCPILQLCRAQGPPLCPCLVLKYVWMEPTLGMLCEACPHRA